MRTIFSVLVMMLSMTAWAGEAEPEIDPAIEPRFKALTSELRCLKCQNQTIFDSKAGLADDLRKQITDQINAGKSDDEIVDYLVARYGEFVRYKPAMTGATLLLWFGPFLLMVIGVVVLIIQMKKRRQIVTEAPLSDEERQRVAALLKNKRGE